MAALIRILQMATLLHLGQLAPIMQDLWIELVSSIAWQFTTERHKERQTSPDEPAIKPFWRGSFNILIFLKILPHFVFYGDTAMDLSGWCCLGSSPIGTLSCIISGREKSGKKQRERVRIGPWNGGYYRKNSLYLLSEQVSAVWPKYVLSILTCLCKLNI